MCQVGCCTSRFLIYLLGFISKERVRVWEVGVFVDCRLQILYLVFAFASSICWKYNMNGVFDIQKIEEDPNI